MVTQKILIIDPTNPAHAETANKYLQLEWSVETIHNVPLSQGSLSTPQVLLVLRTHLNSPRYPEDNA